MKSLYKFSLLIPFVTLHAITFCMHTKLSIVNRFKNSRTYIVTLPSLDAEKGRRDAYQKWYPRPINWDYKALDTINKIEFKSETSKKENKFGYWQQFIKE